MDASRFDRLTAILATTRSRRGAVAALLGVVALGSASGGALGKGGRKRKRKRREDAGDSADTVACYPGTNCAPGRGKTNAGCDYSGSDLFVNLDARGAILANSNFTGADASGADFRAAVLNGACFVDADLTDARIDNSTVLDRAIFCNTVMPDGSIDNSGCGRQTTCCPCPDGNCDRPVGDQPDCEGVLKRAGCILIPVAPIHWSCPPTANLRGADLSGCQMTHAFLSGVHLDNAFLNRANLTSATLRGTHLEGATMDSVTAPNAVFESAILTNASMADTNLRGANFQNADIRLRDWRRTTCPDGVRVELGRRNCCNQLNGHTAQACS